MSDPERSEDEIEKIIESNEVIEEDGRVDDLEAQGNEQDVADATKKEEVKVKKVRNPQPKLNVERLKGPRGIQTIEGIFEKVKFKGRGYEEHDLKTLLKGYQYWCHRLYPKFMFEDCIERIERLGTNKLLQTHIKKIRMDMLFLDDEEIVSNDEENEGGLEPEIDPFNVLISTESQQSVPDELSEEQLERIRLNKEQALRRRQQRNMTQTQSQLVGEASTSNMIQDEDILNTCVESLPDELESDSEFAIRDLSPATVEKSSEDSLIRNELCQANKDMQELSTSNVFQDVFPTSEQASSEDFSNKEIISEVENMDLD
ncbi:hypothetical protein FQR65_LT03133 [Abscondita terminalis]|nr:hypothetical protein FQR65_LT03133 [Abscondita terminalis]